MVVRVLVAGQDALDARAHHLQEGVVGEMGVARVVEGLGKGAGEPDALVELADREQPGVAGELARRRLQDERRAEEIEALRPDRRYTHPLSPAG